MVPFWLSKSENRKRKKKRKNRNPQRSSGPLVNEPARVLASPHWAISLTGLRLTKPYWLLPTAAAPTHLAAPPRKPRSTHLAAQRRRLQAQPWRPRRGACSRASAASLSPRAVARASPSCPLPVSSPRSPSSPTPTTTTLGARAGAGAGSSRLGPASWAPPRGEPA